MWYLIDIFWFYIGMVLWFIIWWLIKSFNEIRSKVRPYVRMMIRQLSGFSYARNEFFLYKKNRQIFLINPRAEYITKILLIDIEFIINSKLQKKSMISDTTGAKSTWKRWCSLRDDIFEYKQTYRTRYHDRHESQKLLYRQTEGTRTYVDTDEIEYVHLRLSRLRSVRENKRLGKNREDQKKNRSRKEIRKTNMKSKSKKSQCTTAWQERKKEERKNREKNKIGEQSTEDKRR